MPFTSTIPCEIVYIDENVTGFAKWSPIIHKGYRFEHLSNQRDVVVTIVYTKLTPKELVQIGSKNGARCHIFCYPRHCLGVGDLDQIYRIFRERSDTPKLILHNETSFNEHGELMKNLIDTIIEMRNLLHIE
jgi:hypothetical protein